MKKQQKYYNRKVTIDGETFDSVKECRRYQELKLLQRAGVISNLERQVPFELIPAQRIDGKVIERACTYVADFVYWEKTKSGKVETVVEDTKGFKTKDYIIKRKLMLWVNNIQIREI